LFSAIKVTWVILTVLFVCQPLSVEDENLVPENIRQDANNMDSSKDTSCHLGTLDGNGNCNAVSQNIVSAAQAQTVFYGGWFIICNTILQYLLIYFIINCSADDMDI